MQRQIIEILKLERQIIIQNDNDKIDQVELENSKKVLNHYQHLSE